MKTWISELLFVITILTCVLAYNGINGPEIFGTLAVITTFCYVQVATRLDESIRNKQDHDSGHEVHCRAWLTRYLLLKEILWCAYFSLLGAWSALFGVAIFIAYPFWRKYRPKTEYDCDAEDYDDVPREPPPQRRPDIDDFIEVISKAVKQKREQDGD